MVYIQSYICFFEYIVQYLHLGKTTRFPKICSTLDPPITLRCHFKIVFKKIHRRLPFTKIVYKLCKLFYSVLKCAAKKNDRKSRMERLCGKQVKKT